jgi:hypothetical protein
MIHYAKCKLERRHNRSYHQESRTILYVILHFLVLLYFYEVDWYCLMIMFEHIRRNCLPSSHLLIPIPTTTKFGWNLFTNIGEYVLHNIFRNETWMLIWSLWYMIVLVREWKTISAKINHEGWMQCSWWLKLPMWNGGMFRLGLLCQAHFNWCFSKHYWRIAWGMS